MNGITDKQELLKQVEKTFDMEINAITTTRDRVGESILKAAELILNHTGKIIVSGIGKSGHIGHKLVATFCSTGTPAVFLHAAEAVHGDFGVYTPGDPTILISKSGSTEELVRLLPMLRRFKSPMIAIVGNLNSPISKESDVTIDARVEKEADPLGLAPTASTAVTLAIGDALASVLMYSRHFTESDFAQFHPAGQLGRELTLQVRDVMHSNAAQVLPETEFSDVIIEMTEKPFGAACVVDKDGHLEGIITEGDIRRVLHQDLDSIKYLKAKDMMTVDPVFATPDISLRNAERLMEDRPSQISVLPVLEAATKICLGVIRLHDILQPRIT